VIIKPGYYTFASILVSKETYHTQVFVLSMKKSQQAQNKTSKLVWFFFGHFLFELPLSLSLSSHTLLSIYLYIYLSIYLYIFIIIIQWNNIYGLSPYYTTLLFFFYFFTATTGFWSPTKCQIQLDRGGKGRRREEKRREEGGVLLVILLQ